jgi:hypothetical protein
MGQVSERYKELARLATERAKAILVKGDRVRRVKCGGNTGVLTFTHWDGPWICSRETSDCHALNVLTVNNVPAKFLTDEERQELEAEKAPNRLSAFVPGV